MDSNQRIDYLYKEYTRLSEKAEEQIKSTYDDFKLLGVSHYSGDDSDKQHAALCLLLVSFFCFN